jgi:phenylacetate-CoA ligase
MEVAGYRFRRHRLMQFSPPGKVVGSVARRFGDALIRRKCCDPFDPDYRRAADSLERWRPHVLFGYTSYLRGLAEFLLGVGRRFPVLLVMTTSETLTDKDRSLIARAFCAPVCDQYGSTEFGRVATEYEEGRGMLINADLTLVETSGTYAVQGGEIGELILTNLVNFGMPFIRYRIGDLGRLSRDPAVHYPGFPTLERLDGRSHDTLLRSDGQRIVPEFVHRVLREYEEIQRYQLVQHSARQLELKLQAGQHLAEARIEAIRSELMRYLGPVSLTLSYCDCIGSSSSKFKHVVSLVNTATGTPVCEPAVHAPMLPG